MPDDSQIGHQKSSFSKKLNKKGQFLLNSIHNSQKKSITPITHDSFSSQFLSP